MGYNLKKIKLKNGYVWLGALPLRQVPILLSVVCLPRILRLPRAFHPQFPHIPHPLQSLDPPKKVRFPCLGLSEEYSHQQSKINNFQGWIYFLRVDSLNMSSFRRHLFGWRYYRRIRNPLDWSLLGQRKKKLEQLECSPLSQYPSICYLLTDGQGIHKWLFKAI